MSNDPSDWPANRHIEEAQLLLRRAEQDVSENYRRMTGENKTDLLLTALTHGVIAIAKKIGRI